MTLRLPGLILVAVLVICSVTANPPDVAPQAGTANAKPTDGYTVHVLAPHVVKGKVMGPFHHYCKTISPEPIISVSDL